MKITKTRLKQIITEEITSVLEEMTAADEAASLGTLLLRTITRDRGKRNRTADLVREIFKVLGGAEALQALEDSLTKIDMGAEPEPEPRAIIPGKRLSPDELSLAEDDDWIQDAEKDIEKRGTEGVCTGDKFGSDECPPGSKRYNLAKTFRKMAKDKKK